VGEKEQMIDGCESKELQEELERVAQFSHRMSYFWCRLEVISSAWQHSSAEVAVEGEVEGAVLGFLELT
jgi:inosine/xanthosine triphosphate pyrophosphatase family protein